MPAVAIAAFALLVAMLLFSSIKCSSLRQKK